jgi:hypothetical protein
MWWLTHNRISSPFHAALFELFVQVQLLSGVVATVGHVPSINSSIADTVSRLFMLSGGKAYRLLLSAPTVQACLTPLGIRYGDLKTMKLSCHTTPDFLGSAIRLDTIITYYNKLNCLPRIVNSATQYNLFKLKGNNEDISHQFFVIQMKLMQCPPNQGFALFFTHMNSRC